MIPLISVLYRFSCTKNLFTHRHTLYIYIYIYIYIYKKIEKTNDPNMMIYCDVQVDIRCFGLYNLLWDLNMANNVWTNINDV